MFFTPMHGTVRMFHRCRTWLGLSVSGTAILAAGVVVVLGTTIGFAGVSEDVTRHNGLATTDPGHLRWFVQHRPTALVSLARVLTEIGSPVVLGLLAVLAAATLWMRGQRLAIALAPGLALAVGGAAAAVAKAVVGRPRPPVALHLVAEADASFPSGHATDATAVFMTLALIAAVYAFRRPLARCLAVAGGALLPGAIGASRLVLGVHWPTDVLAGWALGLVAALVTTIAVSLVVSVAGKGTPSPQRRPLLARVAYLMNRERNMRSPYAA